jgi:lipopolysaccharide transport protein LptA
MKKTLLFGLLSLFFSPCVIAQLAEGAFDTISISADNASEDERPGILYFSGNFLMQSSDWSLSSAQATVYGSPNKPDRVHLEGSPARFQVSRLEGEGQGPVEATALVVEYVRKEDKLTLRGSAVLALGDEVVRSEYIEYDIANHRYQTGGTEGVSIIVPPVD